MNPQNKEHRPDESTGDKLTCPVCGDERVSTFFHQDAFEYGTGASAVTLHVDLPVRRCTACDLEFLDHEGERIKHEAVCRHLGILTSTEIRAIRKKHGMTRSSFAQVTGLGEATLNRWENGVVIQNHANDRYLKLLANPDVFARLTELLSRPRIPQPDPVSDRRSQFRVLRVSEDHRRSQARFQLRRAS